jgi:hypothetical protein
MQMGEAAAAYRQARERARWMTDTRLRYLERRGRRTARAGGLDAEAAVSLAAVRNELAARGHRLQPLHRGVP